MSKYIKWILGIIGLVFLLVYPKLFGIYFTNVLVIFGVYALYAVTLNLLLGYTGLLCFGMAMFFGVGGYATALGLTHIEGLPLLVSIAFGPLASVTLALILSPLLVKVSGTAFAMLTMAFGQLMYVLALKLRGITGGEDGIGGFPIPPLNIPGIVSIDMADTTNFYYFAAVLLIGSIWLIWFFTKTPFGSIMVSVRDNADRVDYMGFKVPQTKAVIFLIAGGFAGVAGSIYALFQNLISADGAFHILNSFQPLMMTVLGGMASFFGPIIGSGIFSVLEEMTSRYTERVEMVTGLVLVLVILFTPTGATGLVKIVREKWLMRSQVVTEAEEV
jgi:branched-chain amino acid transport system permease protein